MGALPKRVDMSILVTCRNVPGARNPAHGVGLRDAPIRVEMSLDAAEKSLIVVLGRNLYWISWSSAFATEVGCSFTCFASAETFGTTFVGWASRRYELTSPALRCLRRALRAAGCTWFQRRILRVVLGRNPDWISWTSALPPKWGVALPASLRPKHLVLRLLDGRSRRYELKSPAPRCLRRAFRAAGCTWFQKRILRSFPNLELL